MLKITIYSNWIQETNAICPSPEKVEQGGQPRQDNDWCKSRSKQVVSYIFDKL